jgi:hypothetical protein
MEMFSQGHLTQTQSIKKTLKLSRFTKTRNKNNDRLCDDLRKKVITILLIWNALFSSKKYLATM